MICEPACARRSTPFIGAAVERVGMRMADRFWQRGTGRREFAREGRCDGREGRTATVQMSERGMERGERGGLYKNCTFSARRI